MLQLLFVAAAVLEFADKTVWELVRNEMHHQTWATPEQNFEKNSIKHLRIKSNRFCDG